MSKFTMIELWKDCPNKCSFCYNKGQPDVNKVSSLQWVNSILPKIRTSKIGIIGGEFFSGQISNPEVKSLFYELFFILKNMCEKNNILLLLNTSLIYNMELFLLPFLKELDFKKLILCTSYDSKGRFTDKSFELWKYNMLTLKNFNSISIHTEIILTQHFIDKVIQQEFNPKKFSIKYNTEIDYLFPQQGLCDKTKNELLERNFFPTRESFLTFLDYCYRNDLLDFSRFLNFNNRADEIYCIINGKRVHIKDRYKYKKSYGNFLPYYYEGYSNSSISIYQDIEVFKQTIGA